MQSDIQKCQKLNAKDHSPSGTGEGGSKGSAYGGRWNFTLAKHLYPFFPASINHILTHRRYLN
jgi:hypothetical protein